MAARAARAARQVVLAVAVMRAMQVVPQHQVKAMLVVQVKLLPLVAVAARVPLEQMVCQAFRLVMAVMVQALIPLGVLQQPRVKM